MGFLCAGPLLPYRQALLTDRPPERILVLGGAMWIVSGPACSWRVSCACHWW